VRREFSLICGKSCKDTLTITTWSGHIGHWPRMRRPFVASSGAGISCHVLSSAGFITIMCGIRFSVHTGELRGFVVLDKFANARSLTRYVKGHSHPYLFSAAFITNNAGSSFGTHRRNRTEPPAKRSVSFPKIPSGGQPFSATGVSDSWWPPPPPRADLICGRDREYP